VELHTVVPAGRIQRVSAAILVDDAVVKSVQGGKVTFTPRRRSQEELNQIQQLAEAVIGFDTKRGDTVSVQNMSFDSNAGATDLPPLAWTDRARKTVSDYSSLLRPVSLLVLFLMAYLFVLRPIQKEALRPGLVHVAEQPALAPGPKSDQFALGAEALVDPTHRAGQLKEQAIELIKQKPANTARAVQAWLREESL
jgi:flagellar M-ring protein FliF